MAGFDTVDVSEISDLLIFPEEIHQDSSMLNPQQLLEPELVEDLDTDFLDFGEGSEDLSDISFPLGFNQNHEKQVVVDTSSEQRRISYESYSSQDSSYSYSSGYDSAVVPMDTELEDAFDAVLDTSPVPSNTSTSNSNSLGLADTLSNTNPSTGTTAGAITTASTVSTALTPATSSSGTGGGHVVPSYICRVCGDHATGRHYGVNACNACRAFFRRTVLHKETFTCQHDGKCGVSARHRNRCRACRYQKCLQLGMRPGDVTKPRALTFPGEDGSSSTIVEIDGSVVLRSGQTLSVSHLLETYYASQARAESTVEVFAADGQTIANDWRQSVLAYHNAIQAELFKFVEWAKMLPGFRDLSMEDQILLLRSSGRKHVALQMGYETARCAQDYDSMTLILCKKVRTPIFSEALDAYSKLKSKSPCSVLLSGIYNDLATPLKESGISDEEYILFEALLLLDPSVKGLSDPKKVAMLRRGVQSLFMGERAINPALVFKVMDLHLLLPAIDNWGFEHMADIRDCDYFSTIGQPAKLLMDVFFE